MASTLEFSIRPAQPGDEHALFALVQELARFERLEHQVSGSAKQLREHLFGARPVAEALLAEIAEKPVGFALFFTSYSTFLTRPGIYLEDLFVLESQRKLGIVTRSCLLAAVAECRQLVGELLTLLFRSPELCTRRFQRRLGDAALGTHRRLPRKQLGERGFGIA